MFQVQHVTRNTRETALDGVNVIVGVCLALSPWVLGFMAEGTAAWSAWIAGVVIALVAIGALVAFVEWEEWANVVVGLWTLVAPWVLGFTVVTNATMAHVIAGVIVAVFAAMELWFVHHRPISSA